MNFETMTEKLQNILIKALTICKDNGNPELTLEHLFKAFLDDNDVISILNKLNTNINGSTSMRKESHNCVLTRIVKLFFKF